jgi:hypothetical protein
MYHQFRLNLMFHLSHYHPIHHLNLMFLKSHLLHLPQNHRLNELRRLNLMFPLNHLLH